MLKKIKLLLTMVLVLSLVAASAAPALAVSAEPEFSGYIVKLAETGDSAVRQLSLAQELAPVTGGHGLYLTAGSAALLPLAESGLVEYVEPNCKVQLLGKVNDPYFDQQWNLTDTGFDVAWDLGLDGSGVRIAVIDSGVNASHEDFSAATIATGVNMLNNSTGVSDETGHGTAVSGIIAATRDNGKGIAGITDKVELVPFKCFDGGDETDVLYVISAIYMAVDDYDCDIINLSLGLRENLKSLEAAVDYAAGKGVITVSAVGNDGVQQRMYPAAYDSVIGVGSVDKTGSVSYFSHYNDSVFVTAPGEEICTLSHSSNNGYSAGVGTSFATPHVTALAAMAKSLNKELDTAGFKQLLIDTCIDKGSEGYDTHYGNGYINARAFAEKITSEPSPSDTDPSAPTLTDAGRGVTATVSFGESVEVDLAQWFSGEDISYSVYSKTASGSVSFGGSVLTFIPNYSDAQKSVRIVISASSRESASEEMAVLVVSVLDPFSSGSSADVFKDMEGHWAKAAVAFGVEEKLLTGTTEDTFAPDMLVDRAMFATILARLSGEDYSSNSGRFPDVDAGSWYAGAVDWAAMKGIVSGYDNGSFGPTDSIAREQLAVLMYRYAMTFGLTDGGYDIKALYGFTDLDSVSLWAADAVGWAVANGLISGRTSTTIAPDGTATRAEVASILERFFRSFVLLDQLYMV